MFERLRESRLMYWSLEALIIVILIICLSNLSFLFAPIATFFSTLLIPFLVAGFLFYLFNPLINLMTKAHIPRAGAITFVFLVVIGLIGLLIATIIPNLIDQITQLVTGLPALLKNLRTELSELSRYRWYQQFGVAKLIAKLKVEPATILPKILGGFSSGVPSLIGSVAGTVISVITIPVLLFYMLKDGERLVPAVQRVFPDKYQTEISTVFTRMSSTLSHYIAGQAIECLFVGSFTFIGYLIIGMPYAFLLGFIAGVVTIIPYLGPYIGIAPALMVALTQGWSKVVLVIVVVLIVQQTDGNLIYPNVIGRSLDIYPLTIIVLLLVAGNLWGILGTILAVPAYAVGKTIVTYAAELYRFHKQQRQSEQTLLQKPKTR
ncbi:MAG: AI-2E family transporter [Lactobacillus sp.]|uniref:AI-2E family transporter n=1 Tax=Lacticaseibacillus suilingensis TaxID=2799577 RepID=A0ABW4BHH4_9LACO|nr:AI-2E family transporter [Lacticaseibacillus suilingensis]MCI1893983.1 AI-2E family transporter [Lactobacillus sp.]MCI1917628.1 AI-2E family transporter [Lactobacillus sp.]MCI1941841.1 AI-2E family transporter [Lactobacillus sp.]MCI1972577.1 AI-2E family transporter [Lactobacillus sp.]MCI2017661.1 AI-2E family transporter [Lactobacillus sp.]